MLIKQGQVIRVNHSRKGSMTVMATKDFETAEVEFWPVSLAQEKPVKGIGDSEGLSMSTRWYEGDPIPCKGSLVIAFEVVKDTDSPSPIKEPDNKS